MYRTLLAPALLVLALCGTAYAQSLTFGPQGEKVMATPVATVVAEPGESDRDFLLRRGKLFRGYTASTGFEVCAQVCRAQDGRLGLSVYTSGSHIGCALVDKCPDAMTPTGDSIHSHPQMLSFRTNDADRAFLRARQPGSHVKRHEGRTVDRNAGFSSVDYDGGPGYLVEGDTLWYQSGRGSVRQVGIIPPAE